MTILRVGRRYAALPACDCDRPHPHAAAAAHRIPAAAATGQTQRHLQDQDVQCCQGPPSLQYLSLVCSPHCSAVILPCKGVFLIDQLGNDQTAPYVQVILAFSKPFWPQGFFDVVCPDCLIPEFWVTSYPATSGSARTSGLVCMTGFVAGARAEELSSWSQTHIIFKTLSQLDDMFGTKRIFGFAVHSCHPAHVSISPWWRCLSAGCVCRVAAAA